MGRKLKGIALLLLAAGVLSAVYSGRHQTHSQELDASPRYHMAPRPAAVLAPRPAAAPAAHASPQAFTRSELGYRWDASRPGIAANEADAAWLESRGFPGPDVEDHLRRLSMQELESLAARGNQPAAAIHAYRLAVSGAPRADVLTRLTRSANEGSVYALKTAGDLYLTVKGYRDPAMASAYYGLQARAGDQSGFEQRYLLSNQLNSEQRLQSDLMQEMLLRTMSPSLQSPTGMDPRPGFNAFLRQGLGSEPLGSSDASE